MNDAYQKLSELLDNWLSDSAKEIKMALIEKEILLEKMRRLYVKFSAMETEERDVPKPEPTKGDLEEAQPKKEYTPAKTMEEDVELFFDTEHESYKTVEQELKNLSDEINDNQKPAETVKPEPEKKEEPVPDLDIFDQIEKSETTAEEIKKSPLEDDADELFEPDFEITVEPETQENTHEEDDILQFLPQKESTEASSTKKPEPVTPKPVEQPKETKKEADNQPVATDKNQPQPKQVEKPTPVEHKENPIQKPQQRSLNDLFNEQREDHSISSQYQRAKVGDLTKAISINDKFIYIKELFHNRGEDFSASIRQLNECKSMEEAFNCLDELKKKFFWDSKTDAYLSFCDLLRRKFS